MLYYIAVVFILTFVLSQSLKHNIKNKRHTNLNIMKKNEFDMDYKIPKWVYKHFKQNKIPSYSKYKIHRKSRVISEEEAMYNAVSVCKLPLGLLQEPSHI
jgi:predicted PP-loop superfamily ATPase